MRLAIAALVLLGALCGCARPSCCDEWTFQGDDPGLYAALGNTTGVEETRDVGWGARHAVLDEIWGEYSLMGISDPEGISLSGRSPERLQLTAGAPPEVDQAALRARVVAFLRETVVANESDLERVADELLANATPLYDETTPHEAGTTPPPTEPRVTFYHYAIDVPYAPRGQAALDAKVGAGGLLPEEGFGRDQGRVEAGGWVFLFSFPMRTVENGALWLTVNAHGGLLGKLALDDPVDEEGARDAIERALREKGAEVDASGWGVAGSSSGPAPEGASPTPTP